MSIYRQHCPFCEGRGQAPAWRTGLTHDSICPKCGGSGFADTSMDALAERLAAAEQRATDAEKVITALATNRDADRDYFASGISEEERSSRARRCSEARHAMFSALWHYEDKATVTAPATQSDERVAAERATEEAADVAFAACEALVLDGDIAEARGRAARALLRRREATDGAAKEGQNTVS